jgi:soluble lytic murein transglycosylase
MVSPARRAVQRRRGVAAITRAAITGFTALAAGVILAVPAAALAAEAGSARDAREARDARAARAQAATKAAGGDPIVEAREAFRRRDRVQLAATAQAVQASGHPLAGWVAYWELTARLREASRSEVEAFYARWRGSYVEDRLRNDWLEELGRRRDWAAFSADLPRFRMNDDREVACYALLVEHQGGRDVREAALSAWLAQREVDDGCQLLARTLIEDRRFTSADVWRKARFAVDANRPRAARAAAGLISPGLETTVGEALEQPARWLQRNVPAPGRVQDEVATLALMRLATTDHDATVQQLESRWERELPDELKAWVWALTAKWAAIRLDEAAPDHFQRAARFTQRAGLELDWPDDTLAWKVRAALRANQGAGRWQQVKQAIGAMSETEQRDPAWVYWKARSLERLASANDSEGLRQEARQLLAGIAGPFTFYGQLALEALGQPLSVPARPAPPTAEERDAAARHAGLGRALQLIALGLRSEGVREWNFSVRWMNDRELLAAAQRACDREVWDRCISTSERTRVEVDLLQRFPTPLRREVLAAARESGVDPAFVYGLIRQESRFIMDARSGVGASGLMQLMPATARWTARKIGIEYRPDMINELEINLRLGTRYLKLVLDDFGGVQPLAAAAYNAGPNRPRRWRDGPTLDAAAWTEGIPFNETRDYVKKVLSNAVLYSAVLGGLPPPAPSRSALSAALPGAGATALPATPLPAAAAAAASDPVAGSAANGTAAPPPTTSIPPMLIPMPAALREATSMRQRLGRLIGPREAAAGEPDRSLP